MPAFREGDQLAQVFGEPSGLLGQVDKPVLDHRGLRVHAHDLVGLRLIAGDVVDALGDQLLDQLRARGLDQHHTRRRRNCICRCDRLLRSSACPLYAVMRV